jgi:hypothetical protein
MTPHEQRPDRGKVGASMSKACGPDDTSVRDGSDTGYQLDLLEQGRRRRDRGVEHAETNTFEPHKQAVLDEIGRMAALGILFTSDDVIEAVLGNVEAQPLGSVGALGAIFQAAVRAGTIEPAGFAPSRRPSRHGAWIRVWRGSRVA